MDTIFCILCIITLQCVIITSSDIIEAYHIGANLEKNVTSANILDRYPDGHCMYPGTPRYALSNIIESNPSINTQDSATYQLPNATYQEYHYLHYPMTHSPQTMSPNKNQSSFNCVTIQTTAIYLQSSTTHQIFGNGTK